MTVTAANECFIEATFNNGVVLICDNRGFNSSGRTP